MFLHVCVNVCILNTGFSWRNIAIAGPTSNEKKKTMHKPGPDC